jgi:hypothetical protein
VVRNEKNPRGDSIAEQYGTPVTASDVEDLLYREQIPAGSRMKIMDVVRKALSWSRVSSSRPYARDLENGLTRQEDARAQKRREALAEALREEGRLAAAAKNADSPGVNSPREDAEEAAADLAARRAGWRGPEKALGATLSPLEGLGGTITPEAPLKPATARSEPLTDIPTVSPQIRNPKSATSGGKAPFEIRVEPWIPAGWSVTHTEPVKPEAPETLDDVFAEMREELAAAVPGGGGQDAVSEAAGTPQAGAEAPPRVTGGGGGPEASEGLSEAAERKTCSQCGHERGLGQFQRDKRASDGRRPSCKICTARYDAMRRSLRKSAKKAVDVAIEAGEDAKKAVEAEIVAPPPEKPIPKKPVAPLKIVKTPKPVKVVRPADRPVVLQKIFRPPVEDEIPELEEDLSLRKCRSCHVGKSEEAYYTRADGRIRSVCKECEIRESRERRIARKLREVL